MANQQELDLLRQGTNVWNIWRTGHLATAPDLTGADLSGTDLSYTNMSGADLTDANLSRADLSGADLSSAYLMDADLSNANLAGADLSDTDLNGANLSRADLGNADLTGSNLMNTNLTGIKLTAADLSHASMGWTIFGDIDLRTVKCLETVTHEGPSTIGADTLERSQGDIPEVFLRGAGLSDTTIAYAHSLKSNPIKYYTCFISYSSQDEVFANRLYADLQQQGVRCWFAPEDLKIGDKFWHRIDESIRIYDKLLVVLSQHSVNSVWVEREVVAALEKEQQQNKTVLFPIKLDETVMQTNLPWAADMRRSRHIGDFTQWKDHDSYQTAFNRLLRDLQASTEQKS